MLTKLSFLALAFFAMFASACAIKKEHLPIFRKTITKPEQVRLQSLEVPSHTLINGKMIIYRFSVTAPPDSDWYLSELKVNTDIGGGFKVFALELYAYADSAFSISASAENPLEIEVIPLPKDEDEDITVFYLSPSYISHNDYLFRVPEGTTLFFELTARVADSEEGDVLIINTPYLQETKRFSR